MITAITRNRFGFAAVSLCTKSLSAIALAAISASATAASITVNSLADDVFPDATGAIFDIGGASVSLSSSKCTLRMALASANLDFAVGGANGCAAGVGADVINIGLTGSIKLSPKGMSVAPLTPEPATAPSLLFAAREVTINGPAVGELIISGELSESLGLRLLTASNGTTTTDAPVAISNVTFYRGRHVNGSGGCFFSRESTTLTNVVFDGCESYGGATVPGYGGAFGIFETTAAGNIRPTVTMTNVTARANRARRGTAASRSEGGVGALGNSTSQVGAVSISASRFESNTAERSGALVIVNASSVSFTNNQVLSNTAYGSTTSPTADLNNGRYGGLSVVGTVGNVAISGGGFLGNVANTERAGFSIITVGGTVLIDDVSVTGNLSRGRIGGFEVLTDSFNPDGSCANASKNQVTISNVEIARNIASTNTGGFRVNCSGAVSITNSTIAGNEVNGSAVAGSGGNSAGQLDGNTSVTLSNLTIAQNRTFKGALDGGFGVFRVANSGSLAASGLTVTDNWAEENEAGLSLSTGAPGRVFAITDSVFARNRAKGLMALFFDRIGDYSVKNTTISGNESTQPGGGQATGFNTKVDSGIAMLLLENVTAARNGPNVTALSIDNFPGGTGAPNASVTVKNSIFGQYQFGSGYWPTNMPVIGGVSYFVSNSLFENGGGAAAGACGSNGVLCGLDAKLEGLAQNGGGVATHALRAGSPALDSGTATSTLSFDQRGTTFARLFGSAVDMGAFESQVALVGPTACKLDMNNDGQVQAVREGLILLRSMLGFSSAAAVVGTGIAQGDWDTTRNNLNANCGTALQ